MSTNFKFDVNYYEDEKNGIIKKDLFSEFAENVVTNFLDKKVDDDYKTDRRGKKKLSKKLTYTQLRKFYEEVLNLKQRLENGEDYKKILPYFKMLKAKANVAYEREVINTNFKTFIEKNVDYVDDNENRFKVFCTFFEAVVAYAKGVIKDK